jgi:cephalosporin hydroxylase
MGIIRFNDDEVFGTDSQEYEILYNATKKIKGTPGAVVEIGTRRGGSARIIIDALTEVGDTARPMFCIDPYGNIDYPETNKAISTFQPGRGVEGDPMSTETVNLIKHDYDNNMRNRIIPSLYFYAYQRGLDFTFFCLEDIEFFARYADGVPVYNEYKQLVNDYAFVFYDGPHTNDFVDKELEFFVPRSPVGAVAVFDDVWMYSHDEIVEQKWLFPNGWELLERGAVKASYIKKK